SSGGLWSAPAGGRSEPHRPLLPSPRPLDRDFVAFTREAGTERVLEPAPVEDWRLKLPAGQQLRVWQGRQRPLETVGGASEAGPAPVDWAPNPDPVAVRGHRRCGQVIEPARLLVEQHDMAETRCQVHSRHDDLYPVPGQRVVDGDPAASRQLLEAVLVPGVSHHAVQVVNGPP